MKTLILTAAAVALLGVAGCGGDDGGSDSSSDGGDSPQCADMWVAGETLPADQDGCYESDGDIGSVSSYECEDGSELVVYDDKMYAVAGDTIHAKDDSYRAAFDACQGR